MSSTNLDSAPSLGGWAAKFSDEKHRLYRVGWKNANHCLEKFGGGEPSPPSVFNFSPNTSTKIGQR
jgi:hypothetical protein